MVRQFVGLGIGFTTGILLGAGIVSSLHAQSNPPVYLVSEITVSNAEVCRKEYASKVQDSINAAGGKAIAVIGQGGGGSRGITALQGEPPQRFAIL
jgi:hypothetical protein